MLYNKITKTLFQRGRYKQGSEAHHPTAPEDYYCSIYFEALDIISVFIKARFHQLSFKDFLNLESVFLQVVNNSNIDNYLVSFINKTHSEDLDTDIIIAESVLLKVMLM